MSDMSMCVRSCVRPQTKLALDPTANIISTSPLNLYAGGGYTLANTKIMQKTWKMIDTLAHGYITESAQWKLSNGYRHDSL